jgi:hypothetical protein
VSGGGKPSPPPPPPPPPLEAEREKRSAKALREVFLNVVYFIALTFLSVFIF